MAVEKFSVEASHIMMFARSVGDDNQVYYDEDYAKDTEPGSIIAPPTFAQASAQFDPNYGLRPPIDGDGWFGSGGKPSGSKPREGGGGGGGAAAEAAACTRSSASSTTVTSSRATYCPLPPSPARRGRSRAGGRASWSSASPSPSTATRTATSSSPPSAWACVPNARLTKAKGGSAMALQASDLNVGDTYTERLVEDLKRTQIVMYAGASGDYNPVHTDEVFTKEVAGYPSVFAHGMLTMGMTGKMVTNYVGDGRLTEYGVRFTSQVFPGDTLDATATVVGVSNGIVDLDISTVNQNGDEVLKGSAKARVDD